MYHASGYKIEGLPEPPKFDWASFKPQRDAYIRKLNGIYHSNFDKEGVEFHQGYGRLKTPHSVEVSLDDGQKYTLEADNICIATGGHPIIPSEEEIPGASLGITSDGFFELEKQPKRVAVAGAGYIAVELAGVFNALGSETHLIIRGETVLRTFDPTIQQVLTPWMEHSGIKIQKSSKIVKVEGEQGKTLTLTLDSGKKIEVDCLLWAVGRRALTKDMGLEEHGVKLDQNGNVVVDEYQNSSVKGITAHSDDVYSNNLLLRPDTNELISGRLFVMLVDHRKVQSSERGFV